MTAPRPRRALHLWCVLIGAGTLACSRDGQRPAIGSQDHGCATPPNDSARAACSALAAVLRRGGLPSQVSQFTRDSLGYCVRTRPLGTVVDGEAAIRVRASGSVSFVVQDDSVADCSHYERAGFMGQDVSAVGSPSAVADTGE